MKIIKRSGSEVTFDISKIMAAVAKANKEVVHSERLSDEQIETISDNVDALSFIIHADKAYGRARKMAEKLKEKIPRHLIMSRASARR